MALLCACLPALAAETKAGGDWLEPTNWTPGIPGPGDGAVIAGHAMTLENIAAAAALRNDGALNIKGSNAPSRTFGALTISQVMVIGDLSTGTLELSKGGKLRSRDTYIGYGTSSIGALMIGGEPSWTGERSSWTNTGQLIVGASGFGQARGDLSVFDGATVSTYNTSIGSGVSNGAVKLNNATWTNTNLFSVGSGGPLGDLSISQRGVLNSLTGVIGYGTGGDNARAGTLGTVSIDNGTWTNSGDFHVGWYAGATLAVRNRGLVENNDGFIGYGTFSVGEATFSNSTWTNRGPLNVGYNGQGTLHINQGGVVTSTIAILGTYGNAKGTVTVDDGSWSNSGELYIGYGTRSPTGVSAQGKLTVRNGGVVTATSALVAYGDGTLGTVQVGGFNGSQQAAQWNLSGNLYVGNLGFGTLEVTAGGVVRSRASFLGYVGAKGRGHLSLDGGVAGRGTFETGQLSGGSGAGVQSASVTFNGGLLRANTDQADFVRNITVMTVDAGGAFIDSNGHSIGTGVGFAGNGGVDKLGQGTLDLRGISTLGALSTIQAGTLLISGSLTGDVQVNAGATLGGGGQVQGRVTVLPGGTLSPGSSPGTLTVASLALRAGSKLLIEVGKPGDHLVVAGDVTLDGTIDFSGDASALGGVAFLSYGGTLLDNGIVIGSLPGGLDPAAFVLDFSTPGTLGVMHAVPEPSTFVLMALGALLMCAVVTSPHCRRPAAG